MSLAVDAIEGRDGRLFLGAFGAVALARAIVALTWRDPAVVAGLNGGTLIALAVAIGCLAAWVTAGRRRDGSPGRVVEQPDVAWADPETRPRF